jgi:hypothetical protein
MKRTFLFALTALLCFSLAACDDPQGPPTAQEQQQHAQESLEQQSNAVAGMPAITNFREKKLVKAIYEMRDRDIQTWTYLWSPFTMKFTLIGESIGFGIPYAVQYTNPEQVHEYSWGQGCCVVTTPQADPNGLYSPADAEGTWILLKNPATGQVSAQYMEERINVFDHQLPDWQVNKGPSK